MDIKLNLGCGRLHKIGYHNIDLIQYIDGKKNEMVDIVLDIEKEKLPFNDNSMEEILADSVFEHLGDGFFLLK